MTIKHRLVGEVSFRVLARMDNGTIPLDMSDEWEAANIVKVNVPQLRGVDDGTSGGSNGVIRFHRRGAVQLQKAFEEIEAAGLKSKLLSFAGSYYPRMIRGSTRTPSEHSFGTALDLNAGWNGLGLTPARVGEKGDLHAIAAIFKKWGFEWGGDWEKRPDGMHFQIKNWFAPPQTGASAIIAPSLFLNGARVVGATVHDGHFTAGVGEVLNALHLSYISDNEKSTGDERYVKVWPK